MSSLQRSVIQQLDSVANEQLMNDEEIYFALWGMMMMLIVCLPSHRPIASMIADCEILSPVPTTLCIAISLCVNTECINIQ